MSKSGNYVICMIKVIGRQTNQKSFYETEKERDDDYFEIKRIYEEHGMYEVFRSRKDGNELIFTTDNFTEATIV
jgi:hypothetical protein